MARCCRCSIVIAILIEFTEAHKPAFHTSATLGRPARMIKIDAGLNADLSVDGIDGGCSSLIRCVLLESDWAVGAVMMFHMVDQTTFFCVGVCSTRDGICCVPSFGRVAHRRLASCSNIIWPKGVSAMLGLRRCMIARLPLPFLRQWLRSLTAPITSSPPTLSEMKAPSSRKATRTSLTIMYYGGSELHPCTLLSWTISTKYASGNARKGNEATFSDQRQDEWSMREEKHLDQQARR